MSRGRYLKHDTQRCVWCSEPFETNHGNALTCSQRCRSNLARYRKLTGMDPDYPPGAVTAQAAYLDLVGQLLAAERKRRMGLAALRSMEQSAVVTRAITKLEDASPESLAPRRRGGDSL